MYILCPFNTIRFYIMIQGDLRVPVHLPEVGYRLVWKPRLTRAVGSDPHGYVDKLLIVNKSTPVPLKSVFM